MNVEDDEQSSLDESNSLEREIRKGMFKTLLFSLFITLLFFILILTMIRDRIEIYTCNYLASTTERLSYQLGRELSLENPEVAKNLIDIFSADIDKVIPGKLNGLQIIADLKNRKGAGWSCQCQLNRLIFSKSIDFGQTNLGHIHGDIEVFNRYYFLAGILVFTLLLSGSFILLSRYLLRLFESHVIEPLHMIASSDFESSSRLLTFEMKSIVDLIYTSHSRAINAEKKLERLRSHEEMSKLARSVSHDIRSPLAALAMVVTQLRDIPENQRILIRNSVNRIQDIANTLLSKGRFHFENSNHQNTSHQTTHHKMEVELLETIIESIISEKRTQFREFQDIEIESCLLDSYGHFAEVNSSDVKRIISNLVNNSVEAMPNRRGKVYVGIDVEASTPTKVVIFIKDNGKGIPKFLTDKLGKEIVTHGKDGISSGNGIGIFESIKAMEKMSGNLTISSQEGVGTDIYLTFPRAKTPSWFVDRITIGSETTIVSLDDDLSIHQIWSDRLSSLIKIRKPISHLRFTSGKEFLEWLKVNQSKEDQAVDSGPKTLFLIDYELINQNFTGLDVIEEMNIGAESILVTSRYDETELRERCARNGVRILPKTCAAQVPIDVVLPDYLKIRLDELEENQALERNTILYDLCLIDDDLDIVQAIWRSMAESRGKSIKIFTSPIEFAKESHLIDKNTPIYVDIELGMLTNGLDFAHHLNQSGFKLINIATGHDPKSINVPNFIKSIVGKDFPL